MLAACDADAPVATGPRQLAAFAAKGNSDTPVISAMADSDPSIASSLQLRSDGLGVYQNSSTLISVIQSIGAWEFDSKNPRNGTRRVYLDFGQPVAGSGPNGGDPVAVPSALYRVRAIAKCNLVGASMWAIAPGATIACPLHIAFDYAGSGYAVQMNPNPAGDPEGAPETQFANATCVAPASGPGPCTQWKLTPSGSFTAADGSLQYRNVARLIKYVTVRNTTTNVNQGDFYFSFAIGVTKP
jgi:hypothetical protein